MKLVLALSILSVCCGQTTRLITPVVVLPNAAHTVPGKLTTRNSTNTGDVNTLDGVSGMSTILSGVFQQGLNIVSGGNTIGIVAPSSSGGFGFLSQLIVSQTVTGNTVAGTCCTVGGAANLNNGLYQAYYSNSLGTVQVVVEGSIGSFVSSTPPMRMNGNGIVGTLNVANGGVRIVNSNSAGVAFVGSCSNTSSGSACNNFNGNGSGSAYAVSIDNALFMAGLGAPTAACTAGICYYFRRDGGSGTMAYSYYGGAWHAGF